ncbi:MAG: flagellar biosynthetic protein FliR [Aestuariivirga sp.]
MIPIASEAVFVGVLVLCRVGSCMMLLPGFGSTRIPMQFRALLAVAISLTLLPLLYEQGAAATRQAGEIGRPMLLGGEMLNGLTIGLLARLFLVALSFSASILTNVIGLAPTPGVPIDDVEAAPPLVNLISLTATMLVFATNLHHELIRALIASYDALKISSPIDMGWYLDQVLERLGQTSELALRLCGPFIVYAIIVNLAIGFANKFTPQISVYFITTGMVAAGGLFLIYFTIDDWFGLFLQDFSSWLK